MSDVIGILEAAYALEGDETRWLERLAEEVASTVEDCRGVRMHTYSVTPSQGIKIREIAEYGLQVGMVSKLISTVALPTSEHPALVPILRRRFVGSLRRAPAVLQRAGLDPERVSHFASNLDRFLRDWGHADHWWVNAQDPTGFGCLIVLPIGSARQLRGRQVHAWHCVAAHVAAAYRVRRQLGGLSARVFDEAGRLPEAVLHPDGRLEHAERPAQGTEARELLRSGVLALDRARGQLRRTDPEQALGIWQALVAGRWSLVDHFDSDGRRYVVAHRNDAEIPDTRGLTHRECQVLAHLALGRSNKIISYELGLSMSTVAAHLASVRAKLNLPSAAALREVAVKSSEIEH